MHKRNEKVFLLQIQVPTDLHRSLKIDAPRNGRTLREECVARLRVPAEPKVEPAKEEKTEKTEVVSFPLHAVSCYCTLCREKRMR